MKKHNKFIAGIMALCLAFGVGVIPESIAPVVSMTASAVDTYNGLTYKIGFDDTVTIVSYDDSSAEVVIPDTIEGCPVTSIGDKAFWNKRITSIKFPDTLIEIGNEAFYSCSSLESINIPDSVKTIGSYAFYDCISLTSANISNNITEIPNYMFLNCKKITSINIPYGVTIIGESAFKSCTELKEIKISDSVTNIGYNAFYDCKNLSEIIIPNSVTEIKGYAFNGCQNLTSIVIPESMASIKVCTFMDCTNLTEIIIPNSVVDIEYGAFWNCDSLQSITLPSNLDNVDSLFLYCDGIKEITILNPECTIYSMGVSQNVNYTIYGYENSTAYEYAKKNDIRFKSLGTIPTKATGDINGDGKFNISDVVTIQKYLLGDSDVKISDWKQADFTGDGVLDVFDLVMMRKKLIEK